MARACVGNVCSRHSLALPLPYQRRSTARIVVRARGQTRTAALPSRALRDAQRIEGRTYLCPALRHRLQQKDALFRHRQDPRALGRTGTPVSIFPTYAPRRTRSPPRRRLIMAVWDSRRGRRPCLGNGNPQVAPIAHSTATDGPRNSPEARLYHRAAHIAVAHMVSAPRHTRRGKSQNYPATTHPVHRDETHTLRDLRPCAIHIYGPGPQRVPPLGARPVPHLPRLHIAHQGSQHCR